MENKEAIFDELKTIMVDMFEVEADLVTLEAQLYDDLGLDSIDAIDMVLHLQDKTGKKVDAEEFKNVRSVQDVVNAVWDLVQAENA